MSIQDLEEKLLTINYHSNRESVKSILNYVSDNSDFFSNCKSNDTLKYVIDTALAPSHIDSQYHKEIFDTAYKLNIPWQILLTIHWKIVGWYKEIPKINENDLQDDRLVELKSLEHYKALTFYCFKNNSTLPDNFINYYVNIDDTNYSLFWFLIIEKRIDLLKTYTSKFTFDPFYENKEVKCIENTDLEEHIFSVIDENNINFNSLNLTCADTDENFHEIVLQLTLQMIRNGVHIKWYCISDYFDRMSMSECVTWYGYFLEYCKDKLSVMSQTKSEIFLEYAKSLFDSCNITGLSTNTTIEFVIALIKRRPDLKNKLIYLSLMNKRIDLIRHLAPDITSDMIIQILKEN